MTASSLTETVQVIRLRNTTSDERELWMEPLGDKVTLKPNVLYEIEVTDALEEIDFSLEGFVVFGWVKSVARTDEQGNKTIIWELPTKGMTR